MVGARTKRKDRPMFETTVAGSLPTHAHAERAFGG